MIPEIAIQELVFRKWSRQTQVSRTLLWINGVKSGVIGVDTTRLSGLLIKEM